MIKAFNGLRPFNLRSVIASKPSLIQQAISVLRRFSTSPAGISDANGYLQKPANLLTWSGDLTNAAWTKTGSTFSGGKLQEDAALSGHIAAQAFTPTAGTTYTAAYALKAAERGFAFFGLNGGGVPSAFATINLSTGVVGVATGSPVNVTSTPLAEGYWLVTASITASTTASMPADVRISSDGIWANRVYQGVAGSGILIQAAGLFQGTYTAAQLQAMGGIPLTTTAASTAVYTRSDIYLPGVGMLNGLTAANYLDSALTTPATIDNPVGGVVDAMGGINATQATTASKPILRRGAVNLLTYSGDFGNAVWLKNTATISGVLFTAPDGTTTANKLIVGNAASTTANDNAGSTSQSPATTATAYTYIFHAKAAEVGFVRVREFVTTGSRAKISLTDGSVVYELGTQSDFGVSTENIGDGWWRIRLTRAAASTLGFSIKPGIDTGDGVSGIYLWRAGLFQGTYTAAQIQALGGIPLTTTAPASTALGPQYWQFDGSNDSLSLGGPLFQMTDDHWAVVAVRCDSASSNLYVMHLASGAGVQQVCALKFMGGVPTAVYNDGTTGILATGSAVPLGSTTVISIQKIGTNVVMRQNSVQVSAISLSTLGATVVTGGAIAAYNAGGSPILTLPGAISHLNAGKGNIASADLILLEKLAANAAGITI